MKTRTFAATLAVVALCLTSTGFAGGTFTSLGSGEAFSISSDGSTIVGESSSTAAKWETSGFTLHLLGTVGGDSGSVARDVSADGGVIVGASGDKIWNPALGQENSSGYFSVGAFDTARGVVWSGSGTSYGSTILTGLPGSQNFTQAYGVSADGNVVVGVADQNFNPLDTTANENGNPDDLAYDQTRFNFNGDGTVKDPPEYDPSGLLIDQWRTGVRWDISSGQTISEIGAGSHSGYNPDFAPGEPKTGSGTVEDPWENYNPRPDYTPPFDRYPDWYFHLPTRSTNADGSLAVGWSQGPAGTNSSLWDGSTGKTKVIPNLAYGRSWAQRMTDNGDYIVGGSWGDGAGGQDTNRVPFRWTEQVNMQPLPFLNDTGQTGQGDGYGEMFGVSENGWFAVGTGRIQVLDGFFFKNVNTAAVWDEVNGMQELGTFLADNGVTGFDGWFFKRATDVLYDEVSDELTIIGYGSPSGNTSDTAAFSSFHIVINDILSRNDYIPGDVDTDGDVDVDDLALLGESYGEKGFWANGDFDGGGRVNLDDLTILGTNYGFGVAGSLMSFEDALVATGFVAVPEPATVMLLGLAGAMVLRRRAR